MKTKIVYLILILVTVGCKSTGERKLSKTQIYLQQRDAAEALERERCDGDEKCAREREAQEAYPITYEFAQKEHLDKFAKEICGVDNDKFPNKKAREECSRKYQEAFSYRLIENYPNANNRAISIWCHAHPIDCRNPENLEQQHKDSEARAIVIAQERRDQAEQEAEEQRRADRRRRIFQAIGDGMQSAGNSMSNSRPIRCTSNQMGRYTYTNCN